jgi:NADH dehydrogenase
MWFQATPFSWFMEKFVLASDAQVMFWQYAIVITTLLVGLAFIGGLFTTLASVYALLFSVIFVLGVGLGFKDMWIPFAAIALLFTGGKALSLDYYFMPWLKKKWNRIGWVRKWYLYND